MLDRTRMLFVFTLLLLLAMPSFAQSRSVLEQAETDAGSFGTFAELAKVAGLEETLNGDGTFTVLMPTNDAIATMLSSLGLTVDDLTANPTLVKTIVEFHILDGKYTSSDITTAYGGEADGVLDLVTLGGETLSLQVQTDGMIVLNAQGIVVFLPDIAAKNGTIHAISGVLYPPSLLDEDGLPTFRAKETIADLLSGAPDFSTLVTALTENGLLDTLSGEEKYTIFAPTNDAFNLAQGDMPEDVLSVLQMHVIPGRVTIQELSNRLVLSGRDVGTLETLGGTIITYQLTADGTVILNGQGISTFTTDVLVDNGVIHYIGNVMLPQREETVGEYIRTNNDFSTLETALETVDLLGALDGEGPFTLLAPTNDAFTALADRLNITVDDLLANPDVLTSILQFHVIEGESSSSDLITQYGGEDDNVLELTTLGSEELTLQADDDDVITLNRQGIDVFLPDISVTNGVIHGISGILIPPSLRDEAGRPTFGSFKSIMDVLSQDANSFSSLVSLLEENNLAGTLSGTGQYTVFAPTNGALLTAQSTLADADVTGVLQFHIIEGRYTAKELGDLYALEDDNVLELTTVAGDELRLQVDDDGTIFLNAQGITVTVSNLTASNGMVHAISGVLLP